MATRKERIQAGEAAKSRILSGQYTPSATPAAVQPKSRRERIQAFETQQESEKGLRAGAKRLEMQETRLEQLQQPITRAIERKERGEVYKPPVTKKKITTPVKKELPGRQLPVIGPVLRGLDIAGEAIEPGVSVLRQIYTPGAGLGTAARGLYGVAGGTLEKYAPQLTSTLGGRIAKGAITGGVVGAPLAAGQELALSGDTKRALEAAGYGALLGAPLEGAVPLLGAGIRAGREAVQRAALRPIAELAQQARLPEAPARYPGTTVPIAPGPAVGRQVAGTPLPVRKLEITPTPAVTPTTRKQRIAAAAGISETVPTAKAEVIPINEVQKQINKLDAEFKKNRELINKSLPKDEADREIKGRAMVLAAEKRKLIQGDRLIPVEGGLTTKELANVTNRLRSNYTGKEVTVNGQDGVITKTAFGKVGVKFADGTEKFVYPDEITPKTDIDEVIRVQQSQKPKAEPPIVTRADEKISTTVNQSPLSRPYTDDATKVTGSVRITFETGDEVRFTERLRERKLVPDELSKMLEERRVTAPRTSLERNEMLAHELIKKHGAEKLYSDLIKRPRNISDSIEGTAARLLSEYYGNIGDYDKVFDLVAKTGVSGREAGQFIQSLSTWKKLSPEGIITAAERQLNRKTRGGVEAIPLTKEQTASYGKMGSELQVLQELNTESKEIATLLSTKGGQPLTDIEVAKLDGFNKKFNNAKGQIKSLEERVKTENATTIKEVNQIAPRYRTRDQVVDYLSAYADQASRELARRKSIGFAAKIEAEPTIILYAKIGASHIAKGLVKFSDWSEAMIKQGITDNLPTLFVKSGDRFRRTNGMPNLNDMNKIVSTAVKNRSIDEQTANSLRAAVTEIGFAANDAKAELTRDLQRNLRTLGDVTLGEQIKTYFTSAMLLNPQTYERNLGGVINQLGLDKLTKAFSMPADWAASKFTGGERTVKFFTNNQANMWKSLGEGTVEGFTGISKTGRLEAEDIRPLTFKSNWNPFKWLQDATGASLEGLDRVAYDQASGEVLATYGHFLGKQKGLSRKQIKDQMPQLIQQLDNKIHVIADEAGMRATYQDTTVLSRLAIGLRKGLNYPTDFISRKLVEVGMTPRLSMEGFGFGDVILFFAKTPANLIVRGLEYSPLGYMNSLAHIVKALPKGRVFDQRKFALSFGRATAGSLGLTMVGWDLYNKGIVTGSASRDKDERALQEATGKGAYKLNMDALRRYIFSGLDPEEAKAREGDHNVNYAWLQPAAISFGMGVSAAKAVDEGKKKAEEMGEEYDPNLIALVSKIFTGSLQTLLENPMVEGVKKISEAVSGLATEGSWQKTLELLTGVPAMAVPSISGQFRRTIDPQMRETYDPTSLWNTAINQAMNRIPKLSERLPQAYGTLGQPRDYYQGEDRSTIERALSQFSDPARTTRIQASPDAQIVLDLLERTGDPSVLPRLQQRSLRIINPKTGKPESVKLTPAQYSNLQQRVGSMTRDLLREAGPEILNDPSLAPDDIAKFIQSMLSKIGSQVRNEFKVEKGFIK